MEILRLHPAVRLVWLGVSGIAFLVLLGLGLLVEVSVRQSGRGWPMPPGVLAVGGALLIAGCSAVWSLLSYSAWGYLLRESDVVIQSGVLWKIRRCVPRARVQHVDIRSGPLDRAFGLVEVHLYTAGAMGAVASIPGLSPEAAEALRAALIRSGSDGV